MLISQQRFGEFLIFHFDVLDSTNNQCKIQIENEPAKNNYVIICDEQTNGRGRSGKEWVSESGNLFFSVVLEVNNEPEVFSLIAAYSLLLAFNRLGLNPLIKWPNDLKLNGKKISGILLEKHKQKLIIGIGVNVVNTPEFLDVSATSIKDSGKNTSKEELLKIFLEEFSKQKEQFLNDGFSVIANKINQMLYNKNNEVKLNYSGKEIMGKIKSIDDSGNLVLETEKGEEKFNAGEVLDI